ncbi:MAG TPA: GNAT family N-acetyltransferase [Aggregatilinea sp.]|uniref:GNAT family N-acetyltransferase n=1 Tax=Aggregatilinea sp. TaxID=2806333 RepID=UPI002BDB99D2|nr:GNAT family N-acetyltransferase [Aggregatilinea sp.]HML23893.1 GNAT family N-acetyltransferase [Aggregatilinea sp.]
MVKLSDRDAIRAFLAQDRALTAYALGDLDDAFWPQSTFYAAYHDGEIASIVLVYEGLDPAVLTAFGDPEGVRAIFDACALPGEIYYLFLPEMESILAARYDLPHMKREWRMVLDPGTFAPAPHHDLRRIEPDDVRALDDLYRHAADPGEAVMAFSPWQIAHGCFYGVWEDDALIAAAGTHVWSGAESVAAIGNVFTMPEYRGRGLASVCTSAVAQAALDAGLETVVLNVRTDNAPAIHVYEKLGFRLYRSFLEGPGLARD